MFDLLEKHEFQVIAPANADVLTYEFSEVWRSVYLDAGYEISSAGRIRNVDTGLVLKPWYSGAGYLYISLWRSGIKTGLHRLVAFAFLGLPPSDRHEVAHNDGNKKNNCVSNLRWATHAENQADIRKHGTGYSHGWQGETHPMAKLNEKQVLEIRRRCQHEKVARKILALEFKVSKASIDHIIQGRTWKHLI